MKEEKIKVLALLPMELPKEIELDNTLEAMQKFVGGLIESRLFVCTCSVKIAAIKSQIPLNSALPAVTPLAQHHPPV